MFKLKKYKGRMIVTAVAIVLIVIIGLTSNERIKLSGIEKNIGNFFSPVQKIFLNVGEFISSKVNTILNISHIKQQNDNLKKKVSLLEQKNREYEDIIAKSDFLKNEVLLKKNSNYKLLDAQIIGKEPGNWFDRFVIDKGTKDGINKGDTVIQAVEVDQNVVEEGIVGRIVDVGDNWSKVVSIIDESSNISFKVVRTQDGGVLSGDIDSKLSGYLFDSKADIVKGDKLFTSGLGGVFRKDLYIGQIDQVIKNDEDLMKQIKVSSAVDFKKLYKVYVILNTK